MKSFTKIALCGMAVAISANVYAAAIVVMPTVADCGGGLAPGADVTLNGSLGQPIAGFVSSSNTLHWSGFWAGEITAPSVLSGIATLKKAADGAYVSLTGLVATSGSDDFSGYFYAEASDRASGVRISPVSGDLAGVRRGSLVTAVGTVGTLASGERQLSATQVTVTATVRALASLGLANRTLGGQDFGLPPLAGQYGVNGGSGLNNVGVLVRTWGRVVSYGKGYLVISDGSADTVRISTGLIIGGPSVGDMVMVTGISSLWLDTTGARQRYILTRNITDITVL